MLLIFLVLCGCSNLPENTSGAAQSKIDGIKDTKFIFDTVVTLTADCDEKNLDEAFKLCEKYEELLSRTKTESEVSLLNSSSDFIEVSEDTVNIISCSLYYSQITNGKFDITICPVSMLWDFSAEIIPSRDEIAEALKNVDYQSIVISGKRVNLGGKKIDLGGIAKGYIADRIKEYFTQQKINTAVINLGGNVSLLGKEEVTVGIRTPFSQNDISARLHLSDTSVVTSGIYERFIESDDKIYHHILDPETGYSVETDLASATVICKSSLDADALSTCCILLKLKAAKELIEETEDTEAIFIDLNGNLHYTSGLYREDIDFFLKNNK